MLSEHRQKINSRWKKRHPSKQRYYNDKSAAKRFILKESKPHDLKNIYKWLCIREDTSTK